VTSADLETLLVSRDAAHLAAARVAAAAGSPEALALEVVHLMTPSVLVTGEIRHVDGGYHTVG